MRSAWRRSCPSALSAAGAFFRPETMARACASEMVPADHARPISSNRSDSSAARRTSACALRRVIRFRGRAYEVDAGLMARFRLRATGE